MPTFSVGDRIKYVGRSEYPCEPKQGALGTVVWSGNLVFQFEPTLFDWVRIKWDDPPVSFDTEHRADQVKLAS